MTDATADARATLDAWRASGADRLNPVRFHFMDALERRAAAHSGEARRLLDEKLAELLAAYALDVANTVPTSVPTSVPETAPTDSDLARLIGYLSGQTAAASSYPEMPVLDYFREVSSKVRTERQFRQSLEQVPGNAGPLNSNSLVHRALTLMRESSPGYLQQFLSYVDTLSWLEQMNGGSTGGVSGKDAPRATGGRKSGRTKGR
ncbi:hypothetical protein P3T18_006102 [Paraburkholderia sp. GAS199]|uniref:DUF2894 domain-containing protein n=1 Tax=Paraburkholderia sp. GAS199 TaxID=3035126 RepID=UPI003D1C7DB4